MLIPLLLFLQAHYFHTEAEVPLPTSEIYNNFKIFGGRDINITEAPYTVSIRQKGLFICGGTLIAKDIVLTLAQCLEGKRNKNSFVKVRAGSSFIDQGGEDHAVKKFLIHPHYNRDDFDNDVGIIWLSTPVTFSDRIAAIEMKSQGEEVGDGEPTTFTGWGLTSEHDFPIQLQQVVIQAVNASECVKTIEIPITPRQMCAGVPEGGKGFCFGDFGGPLVHNNKLAGMASWMRGMCLVNQYPPQVYTKVSAMRSWIDEAIKNYTRHN